MAARRRAACLFTGACIIVSVATPVLGQWSGQLGGVAGETLTDTGFDETHSLYLIGTFSESVTIAGIDLSAGGTAPMYLAQLDSAGAHQWSKAVDGTFTSLKLAAANGGGLAAGGTFTGQIDLDGRVHDGGASGIFVAQFDSDGNILGSESGSLIGQKQVVGLDVDPDNNLVAAGAFSGDINLGGETLSGVGGGTDMFLVKYTGGLRHLWSVSFGGTAEDHPIHSTLDAQGGLYVTGGFLPAGQGVAETNLGGETLTGRGGSDAFVASYDTEGAHRWSYAFGSELNDAGIHVASDASSNVFVTGYFEGSLSIGADILTSRGGTDVFLAKFSKDGDLQWAVSFGGSGNDFPSSVGIGEDQNPVVFGRFSESIDVDEETLAGAGGTDVFLASWNTDGEFRRVRAFGGPAEDLAGPLAIDRSGDLLASWTFSGTLDLGFGQVTSLGDSDVFLFRLQSESLRPVGAKEERPLFERPAVSMPFPNPTSGSITMNVGAAQQQHVRVVVYDLLGREMGLLFQGVVGPGRHRQVRLDLSGLASGSYAIRVVGGSTSTVRTVVKR